MRVDNIGKRVTQWSSICLLRVTEPKTWSPARQTQRMGLYTTDISDACDACDASLPRRRQYKNQRPAFWWNTEISELRKCCIKQRRKAQRAWKKRRPEKQEEKGRYKDTSKFCAPMSTETHGALPIAYKWCEISRRGKDRAPTDVPTVLKIAEALFPKGAPRESYPSDVALKWCEIPT